MALLSLVYGLHMQHISFLGTSYLTFAQERHVISPYPLHPLHQRQNVVRASPLERSFVKLYACLIGLSGQVPWRL
jgi:hypothetical protein